jgi:hypothetical protein
MKIYRPSDPDPIQIADVKIDISTVLTQQLMGEHKVDANWISPAPLDVQLGDYIVVGAEKLYINQPVSFRKTTNFTYRYEAIFEGEIYRLYRKELRHLKNKKFSYFGDPEGYLLLIIENMNAIDPGWTLNLSLPVAYEPLELSFDATSCRTALSQVMEAFKLEFRLVQKEIIVREDVGFTSTYSFSYGRGNGLYTLIRLRKNESSVITRLYGYGGSTNIPSGYRGGATELIFEHEGENYIEANTDIYEIREGSVTFPEIFPRRTGSLTAVQENNVVRDSTLDFDINAHLIPGVTPKIVFKSGALSGYEFDIEVYNHPTRQIKFIPRQEAGGAPIPDTGSFQPEVGDTYTLVGIDMPASYREAAEAELKAATQEAHKKLKVPEVVYELPLDEKFIRENGVELGLGMKVYVADEEIGLDDQIRIFAISFPLVKPAQLTVQIADGVPLTTRERTTKTIGKVQRDVIEIDRSRIENYREAAERFRTLQTKIYNVDGYFNNENIRPNSIETLMLSVGAKSQNFLLNLVEIEANYQGDPNALRISSGTLIHVEIQIEGLGYIWEMDGQIFTGLTPTASYYVYAKCNKSALTGTWVVSETPIDTEAVAGFYHFWLGILYPVKNDIRFFQFTKGMTYIVGDTITTGKIQSLDGLNFFDVTHGTFNLGTETSGLDWNITNEGALTVRGAVLTDVIFADEGAIKNLKVKSLRTGTEGKRMEILAYADAEETIEAHHQKFYDDNGEMVLIIDTEIDAGYSGTPKAGIRITNPENDRVAISSGNGHFSNAGGVQFESSATGRDTNASIAGLLFDRNSDDDGISAAVAGIDATTSGASKSFGGYFNSIQAGALHHGLIKINSNYTVAKGISSVVCYNETPITVYLPPNPKEGWVVYVKRVNDAGVNVDGNGKYITANGAPQSSRPINPKGLKLMLEFDGAFWQSNGL